MSFPVDVMTPDEFKLFRELIYDECGIFLSEGRRDFLKARLEKRLKALDIKSYFNYYRYIKDKNNIGELYSFLDSITINETSFFRNTPQFDIFRNKVMPELLERKKRNGDYDVLLWSAGCATGEEPYSMAIEALEAIPNTFLWNIKVIASDISLKCLEVAQAGIYPAEKVKDMSERYLEKYFRYSNGLYYVNESLKQFVIFDYHNLKHENGLAGVDVIFCRNVMIYFDVEEQRRIVRRLQKTLKTGGYLFLGHAESLHGLVNGDFRFLYWNKGTAYQKVKDEHE